MQAVNPIAQPDAPEDGVDDWNELPLNQEIDANDAHPDPFDSKQSEMSKVPNEDLHVVRSKKEYPCPAYDNFKKFSLEMVCYTLHQNSHGLFDFDSS